MSLAHIFSSTPAFANLTLLSELDAGVQSGRPRDKVRRTVRAKEHVFFEDDPRSHIYEVVEGSICVYKLLGDGRRQVVAFGARGDLIGMGMGDTYLYSAEAITVTQLNCYPVATVERLAKERPDLSHALLAFAMAELAAVRDQLLSLGRKTALERVSSFLLDLSGKRRLRGESPQRVTLPMTQSDIADYLGLTLETVSRNITRLRDSGVIARAQRDTIEILDMEALERMAEASDGDF